MLSSREANITFKNEMNPHDPFYCKVGIKVDEILYDTGEKYFDIGYTYDYHGEESSRRLIQPLYKADDHDGVIVLKNTMTEVMVDYLLMDDEDLQKVAGSSTAQHYRLQIMRNLNMLWD